MQGESRGSGTRVHLLRSGGRSSSSGERTFRRLGQGVRLLAGGPPGAAWALQREWPLGPAGPGNWEEGVLGPWRRLQLPPVCALPGVSQPTTFPHPFLGRHSGPGLGGENETGGEETFPPFSPSPASAPWLPPSLPSAKGQRIATRNPIDWYEGPRGPELANDQAARDELIMEAICNFQ